MYPPRGDALGGDALYRPLYKRNAEEIQMELVLGGRRVSLKFWSQS